MTEKETLLLNPLSSAHIKRGQLLAFCLKPSLVRENMLGQAALVSGYPVRRSSNRSPSHQPAVSMTYSSGLRVRGKISSLGTGFWVQGGFFREGGECEALLARTGILVEFLWMKSPLCVAGGLWGGEEQKPGRVAVTAEPRRRKPPATTKEAE